MSALLSVQCLESDTTHTSMTMVVHVSLYPTTATTEAASQRQDSNSMKAGRTLRRKPNRAWIRAVIKTRALRTAYVQLSTFVFV